MFDGDVRLVPISECLRQIIGGGTPPRNVSSYWNGPIPWASVKDFSDDELEISETKEHITSAGLKASASNLVPPGVPILCTRMAVGRVAAAAQPVAINQDLKALVVRREIIEPRFLLYALKRIQPKLEARSVGSTVKGLSLQDVVTAEVLLLPLPEQRLVVEICDASDTLIREAELLLTKLNYLRKGLLHDLLTRGIDGNGKLRDPVRYPEQFKASPIGQIPVDWEFGPLSSVSQVDRGRFAHRPRNDPRFYGGPLPFVQTGDISAAQGRVLYNYSQTLNEYGARVSREFPAGTIAVTIAANIADTTILGLSMYFPDSVVGVVVRKPYNARFVELCIRRSKPRLEARAPQSAQKNINLEDLRPLTIPIPDPEEQKRIAMVYETLLSRIEKEEAFLAKLRLLRLGLMDDLLTGRVRVPIPEEAAK